MRQLSTHYDKHFVDVIKTEKTCLHITTLFSKTFTLILLSGDSMKVNKKNERTKEETTSSIVTSKVSEYMNKDEKSSFS